MLRHTFLWWHLCRNCRNSCDCWGQIPLGQIPRNFLVADVTRKSPKIRSSYEEVTKNWSQWNLALYTQSMYTVTCKACRIGGFVCVVLTEALLWMINEWHAMTAPACHSSFEYLRPSVTCIWKAILRVLRARVVAKMIPSNHRLMLSHTWHSDIVTQVIIVGLRLTSYLFLLHHFL